MGTIHQALLGMHGAAGGSGVSDNFNRADDAGLLGTSSSGHVWTAEAGTWGIASNQARLHTNTTNAIAVLESSLANCTVQVTLAILGGFRPGLAFRYVDSGNYWIWYRVTSTLYQCWKRVAGTFTEMHGASLTAADGDVIKVVLSGTSIELWHQGSLITTLTGQTDHQNATKHGLYSETGLPTTTRWDDFSVTP